MATTIPSADLVPVAPVFTHSERLALAGFLAGYSGLTRQAYGCCACSRGPAMRTGACGIDGGA